MKENIIALSKEKGLPPIIDKTTEVLIIGTFPSEISRNIKQYYANEDKNDFWMIFRQKYGMNLLNYNDKINILTLKKIGLWDVFNECYVQGSKNSSIAYGENDFNEIIENVRNSNVKKIIINGCSKNKGTKEFFEQYIKYAKQNKKLSFPDNIEFVYLHMPVGKYYSTHKFQVIKEWIDALPD